MPIKLEIDKATFDSLDDTLKDEYDVFGGNEDEPRYRLKAAIEEEWQSPDDIHGLKQALDRERQNARSNAGKAKQADDLRPKAEKADALEQELEEARKANADIKKKLGAAQTERQVIAAIAETKGRMNVLLPVIKDKVRMGDNGVEVVDENGDLMLGDDGKPLSVKGLLNQMADSEDYAVLFEARGMSGGGSPPNGSSNVNRSDFQPTSTKPRRSQMSAKAKVAFIKEHGDPAFQNLPY